MTKEEKDLAWLLLQENHYLVRSINVSGKEVYKILRGKQIPIQYFTHATVRRFFHLLRPNSKNRFILNLNAVRQLNGNNYIKKLYQTQREMLAKKN